MAAEMASRETTIPLERRKKELIEEAASRMTNDNVSNDQNPMTGNASLLRGRAGLPDDEMQVAVPDSFVAFSH